MSTQPISSNHTPTFERFLDKYFWVSAAVFLLFFLIALGLAGLDDRESEQLAIEQVADLEAWEQGYEQGQQATEWSRGFAHYYSLARPFQANPKAHL